MKRDRWLHSLERLIELRQRQIEILGADMASRRAVQARFRTSIERLETLCKTSGASGGESNGGAALSAALSLNCAGYKQSVMKLAEAHRIDLALHEADTAVVHRALASATRRQEALSQALERGRASAQESRSAGEQKVQDEMAVQMWERGRKRRPSGI